MATAQGDWVGRPGSKSQDFLVSLRRFEQLKATFFASYTNFLHISHIYEYLLPVLILLDFPVLPTLMREIKTL